MVREIIDRETTTSLNARKKYKKYYIGYITIEDNELDPDNEKVQVTHIANTFDEKYSIPRVDTISGKYISKMAGLGVGGTELGGVYLV